MMRLLLLTDPPRAYDLAEDGLHPADPAVAETAADAVVAVLPGAGIALHRVAVTENGRRLRDEAAMHAAELAAGDSDTLHVAHGPPDAEGMAWIAVADRSLMADQLARLAASGHDPQAMLPAALLLPAPPEGAVATADLDGLTLLRGPDFAAAVEPSLASALFEGRTAAPADPLAALATLRAGLPLDLRQGAFARVVRWWRDRRLMAALAALGALALLLALAPAALASWREQQEIARLDAATLDSARDLVPAFDAETAARALADRRAALTGHGLPDRLARLAQAVAAQPGARLERLNVAPGGRVTATVAGGAAPINGVALALRAAGQAVAQQGDALTIAPAPSPPPATPLAAANARAAQAALDAAAIRAALRMPPPADPAAAVRTAAVAAGLPDMAVTAQPSAADATVPAVRAPVLLGMVAALAAQRAPLASGAITRNADGTVAASLRFQAAP